MGKDSTSAFESAARASEDTLIGQVLGERYQILRRVARGGMATIYAARHLVINRPVAIKVLLPEFAAEMDCVEHFVNEGRAAGTLGHPNIVESTDMGVMPDGTPYLVLELLDGVSLDATIRRSGRFSVARAAHIGRQIASALAAAHAHGIIHRDLKSDNVFLIERPGATDYVKVFDFGISKTIGHRGKNAPGRDASLSGTPDFMPPEQIQHPEAVDERSDIYSLGMVLYHMLAGGLPWEDEPMPQVLEKVLREQPPALAGLRADLPPALIGLVERMLSKTPAVRPRDMAEIEQTLTPFDPEPVPYDLKRSHVSLPAMPAIVAPMASQPETARIDIMPNRRRWTRTTSAVVTALGVVAIASTLALVRRGASGPRAAEASTLHAAAPATLPAAPQPAPQAPVSATVTLHLVATAPGAQATLRGRTFSLPFHAEIPRGTVPEVVRVTAPRYQGRQYWITLDEPRYLAVDLRAGTGFVEATATETAIALGEAPPTERAQAAIWHPAPSREKSATPAAAPAQPLPVVQLPPPAPAPAAALKTAPAPAPLKTAPAPTPVAAAAPAPAPAPSTTPPASHTPSFAAPPPAAPAPAPKAAAPPVVPYGAFIASHKLAGEEPHLPPSLRSSLAETQALARACIAADGHVDDVRVLRSPSASADEAIRSALRGWRFRPFMLQGKAAPLCFDLPISFKRG